MVDGPKATQLVPAAEILNPTSKEVIADSQPLWQFVIFDDSPKSARALSPSYRYYVVAKHALKVAMDDIFGVYAAEAILDLTSNTLEAPWERQLQVKQRFYQNTRKKMKLKTRTVTFHVSLFPVDPSQK